MGGKLECLTVSEPERDNHPCNQAIMIPPLTLPYYIHIPHTPHATKRRRKTHTTSSHSTIPHKKEEEKTYHTPHSTLTIPNTTKKRTTHHIHTYPKSMQLLLFRLNFFLSFYFSPKTITPFKRFSLPLTKDYHYPALKDYHNPFSKHKLLSKTINKKHLSPRVQACERDFSF